MIISMKYLLGIDFGGGASKATLLCETGEISATATTEYPTSYPAPGYAEQNPSHWIDATIRNIKDVLKKSRINPGDIAAVSFDAATHTAVVMDDDFNVIRPAIYWTDTRSTEEVLYLKENYSEIIGKQVLHKADTIWSLPELLWIKNNEPENWAKVKKILFAKDYVRHFFTGDYVTDYIEAEGSMLFDITKMEWSVELCSVLGISKEMLPKIIKPMDIIGKITKEASEVTGLAEGTTVVCGTTDTVMEIFASGAIECGDMTLKLATAGRICVVADKPYPDINLINYSHIADGLFYPGTATKSCAASYRWFRDTFGGDYKDLDTMAEKVPIGCEGLVFHPYLNGELTPYANPKLCGDFTGVRAYHTKGHFARSVLEGVAMSMLDCIKTLDDFNIPRKKRAIIIGGGGKSPLWRQMVSDALDIELIEMKHNDSSLGTAMLAGFATGVFESLKAAVQKCNEVVSVTVPDGENTKEYAKLFRRYKAIQKALEPVYNGEY